MKKNRFKIFKIILAFVVGSVISGYIAASAAVSSANVSYSTANSASNGATKTNVSDAIGELYTKAGQCKYKFIDNAYYSNYTTNKIGSLTQDSKISAGTNISCFTTKTFTDNGILLVTVMGVHYGSTSSSSYATPDFTYTLTGDISLIGTTSVSGYRINYEDLSAKTYAFKVKSGSKISNMQCKVTGHDGRMYGFSTFITAS